MHWTVPDRFAVLEGCGAIAFTVAASIAFLSHDTVAVAIAALAAIVLAGVAVRDRVARVRLSADAEAVTLIEGFARRRRIPWQDVVELRVSDRGRRGRRAGGLLEIDTGEAVYLLSGRELGAEPAEVAAALDELRP